MDQQFAYERYQSRSARFVHVLACVVSGLMVGQVMTYVVIYFVQQYVPHWQGDPFFYGMVPVMFGLWLAVWWAMFTHRIHWSTGVGLSLAVFVLFSQLLDLT